MSKSPFSVPAKRTFTPQQITAVAGVPHHHHHVPHHHHHHHTNKRSTPGVAQGKIPKVVVNSKAVMDIVKDLPRSHLGSGLYETTVTKEVAEPYDEPLKFGYQSIVKPIPRFDGKENCTYTIRVPRFHLRSLPLQEICHCRNLFGTEIYTDDSDPIAVAIHSGWIRGAWPEDVDLSSLEIPSLDQVGKTNQIPAANAAGFVTLNEPPKLPMAPLPNRDLHMTVLILPRLEEYASTLQHGLTSRSFKTKHDGMSFKIEKIAWVDEGPGGREERGGEARRKRLRRNMSDAAENKGESIVLDFGTGKDKDIKGGS